MVVNSNGTLAIPVLIPLWCCGCDVVGGQIVKLWVFGTVRSSFLTSIDIRLYRLVFTEISRMFPHFENYNHLSITV
jgi:hypothetical protein